MPVGSVTLCMVTRNKSIYTTTLHSAMNLNMVCMSDGVHLDIQFVSDRNTNIQKIIKSSSSERIVWLDYGVSIDVQTIKKLAFEDFPDGYRAMVVPCVTDDVDWELFKKKTLEGNTEPVNQRGLKFDTTVGPVIKKNGTADYVSSITDCRVFAMDCKAVQRKLRDADATFKSFEHLKKIGVKIGVLCTSPVLCHYVYESIGNILESSGVRTVP